MVYDYCILVYTDGSVIYFTNTDTAYIFIVVDSADENLCIGFRISLRCRDIIQDGIKERFHISAFFSHICFGDTFFGRGEDEWTV